MAINFLNTVAVDDSVLFVDTINDRVGIGTINPTEELTVVGLGRVARIKATNDSVALVTENSGGSAARIF